ncbi:unnamed protein product, partial [Mesorhabditis belari]|uniref:Uncharacterized protein n=1 Tax=Mesorhabditis belari TaxID=2138241 RepID=A0AAF3ENC9_9BILA
MRGYIYIATFLAAVLASDLSFCQRKCRDKYDNEPQQGACFVGCKNRKNDIGMFLFIDCYRKCESIYENSTNNEASACHFACGLPMINSVFMSMNYNGKGKPEVQVIKHDGPKEDRSVENSDLPSHDLFQIFGQKPLQKSSAEDHFESFEDSFDRMFAQMRERFFKNFDSSDNSFQSNHPKSFGSNGFAQSEQQGEVGNINQFGEPILFVHPLSKAEELSNDDDDFNSNGWQGSQQPWYNKERLPLIFQICFLALSLLAILCAIFIFTRILKSRSERYQRVTNCGRMASVSVVPGSKAMPLHFEKNVPFEYGPPKDGVPPPSYDQLSLGSVHKKLNQTAE